MGLVTNVGEPALVAELALARFLELAADLLVVLGVRSACCSRGAACGDVGEAAGVRVLALAAIAEGVADLGALHAAAASGLVAMEVPAVGAELAVACLLPVVALQSSCVRGLLHGLAFRRCCRGGFRLSGSGLRRRGDGFGLVGERGIVGEAAAIPELARARVSEVVADLFLLAATGPRWVLAVQEAAVLAVRAGARVTPLEALE